MNVKTNCLSKSILNGKGYCFILIALLLCIGTISALGENDSTQLPASALGAIQSEGNWTYAVRESDEYAVITGYTGSESSICVPEQICGYEVAGIASGALTNVLFFFRNGTENQIVLCCCQAGNRQAEREFTPFGGLQYYTCQCYVTALGG